MEQVKVKKPQIPNWVAKEIEDNKRVGEPHVWCFLQNLRAKAKLHMDKSAMEYVDLYNEEITLAYLVGYEINECPHFQMTG